MGHDTGTLGEVDQVGLKADEPAGRSLGLHRDALGLVIHVHNLGLASGEALEDVSEIIGRNIDIDGLDRLEKLATIIPLIDDLGAGDEQLEALAAHLLNDDGDLHFSAGLDLEVTGQLRLLYLDGDIGTGLADEALLDLAGGDKFPLLADERAVVDADLHRDRRRIDVHEGEWLAGVVIGDRLPDVDFLEAADADDVTGTCFLKFDFLKALVAEDRGHRLLLLGAVLVDDNNLLTHLDLAADDATEGDTTQVVAVVEIGNEHLEVIHVGLFRGGDVLRDRLVEGLHRGALLVDLVLGKAGLGARVDDGEIELLVRGMKLQEELKDHVEDLVGISVVAVDLVDNNDRLEAVLQRLLEHKFGLGLGAAEGIHHKEHSVHHLHDAFHLAAEVGVTRGVDNVDVVVVPLEGGVLGLDGDSLLTLQIHGIHDTDLRGLRLIGAESARLFQKLVDEGGLPVVDVGDDGDITNVVHGLLSSRLLSPALKSMSTKHAF